jgi:hypothetical protein
MVKESNYSNYIDKFNTYWPKYLIENNGYNERNNKNNTNGEI